MCAIFLKRVAELEVQNSCLSHGLSGSSSLRTVLTSFRSPAFLMLGRRQSLQRFFRCCPCCSCFCRSLQPTFVWHCCRPSMKCWQVMQTMPFPVLQIALVDKAPLLHRSYFFSTSLLLQVRRGASIHPSSPQASPHGFSWSEQRCIRQLGDLRHLEGVLEVLSFNDEGDAGDGTRWLSCLDGLAVVLVSRLS